MIWEIAKNDLPQNCKYLKDYLILKNSTGIKAVQWQLPDL
jgi:hypothetical protein